MNIDLAHFLEPVPDTALSFKDRFPEEFLAVDVPKMVRAWHLIGGKDPIEPDELTGSEPEDGYPVLLRDWIRRDGLKCLKVKLRGDDFAWDYDRLSKVGEIAIEERVDWLTADFNCTVHEPEYVTAMLDRLLKEQPRVYGMLLYVEQPFPYDLEAHRIDVHAVSARKPLFMDESAHDWRFVRLGRALGWSGVALKTCKTQTGAILSLCWAKLHGMTLMVQDLSNPMLAQIPHVLLALTPGRSWVSSPTACNSIRRHRCQRPQFMADSIAAATGVSTCRRFTGRALAIASMRSSASCRLRRFLDGSVDVDKRVRIEQSKAEMLERAAAIQKLVHHPSFGKIGRAAKNDERDPLDLLAGAPSRQRTSPALARRLAPAGCSKG